MKACRYEQVKACGNVMACGNLKPCGNVKACKNVKACGKWHNCNLKTGHHGTGKLEKWKVMLGTDNQSVETGKTGKLGTMLMQRPPNMKYKCTSANGPKTWTLVTKFK